MRTLLLFLLLLPATLIAQIQDSNSPRFRLYGGKLEVQSAPGLPWAGVVTGVLSSAASFSGLSASTSDIVNYDGAFWDRVTGTPSTTLGHGYVTTPATGGAFYKRRVPGNIHMASMWQVIGDSTYSNSTAINRALGYIAATGGGTFRLDGPNTYGMSTRLIIGSNTVIDMNNGRFKMLSNSNGNMFVGAAWVAGSGRNTGITIQNGVIDRGTNGGVANENHTLFFRACDNITLRNLTIYTPANVSKYAIAVANGSNLVIEHIRGKTGSDLAHVTGPWKNVRVHDVIGDFGDDIVGVTTQDYDALNDVHGNIDGVYIDGVAGSNTTRAVTFGVVADTLRNVVVRNVIQRNPAGIPAVTTGDGAYTAGRIDNLTIEDVVGSVQIRHQNAGTIHIARARAKGNVVLVARDSRDPGLGGGNVYGTCHVEQLTISDITSLSGATDELVRVDNDAVVDNMVINGPRVTERGVLGMSALTSRIRQLAINNARLTLRVPLAGLYGRVDQMSLNNVVTNTVVTTVPILNVPASTTVGTINTRNCDFTGLDYSTAAFVEGPGSVSVINVESSAFTTIKRLFESTAGTVGTTTLNLSNLTLTGLNRITQGNANVRINYNNLTLASTQNNPFYVYGGASMTIKGSGWSGWTNSAVVRSSTEVINIVAPDLPADPSIVATTAGNTFIATSNSIGVATGPVVADGTGWLSPLMQPRVLATITGVSGTATGVTTLYTVPSGRQANITSVVVRATGSSAITAPATVEVGQGSNTNDIFPSQALSGLTFQEGTFTLTTTTARRWVNSGTAVKLNVTTGATGTSQTWSVDVVGYLR